ncbi:MAG: hypothetical protein AAF600_15475 [Bacteroidota bacterium]
MKNLFFLLMSFLVVACNNDDGNDAPQHPADALPPPTQTGEGTFGCLIDGDPFFPGRFGLDRPSAFYQFVRGAFTLGISASRGGSVDSKQIVIGALDIEGLNQQTYPLTSRQSGNFFGNFFVGGGGVLDANTQNDNPGVLTITLFTDEIIAGTFEFTILDNDGSEIRITDGRFDLKYTN